MRIKKAYKKLLEIKGMTLGQLGANVQLNEFIINKGGVGQFIEKYLDLKNSSNLVDFKNGELKTYSVKGSGVSKETIAITLLSHDIITGILNDIKFKDSVVYKKINKVIYLGIDKTATSVLDWKVYSVEYLDLKNRMFKKFYNQIEEDYLSISKEILNCFNQSINIKTFSGKYLQIRTKASKNKSGTYDSLIYNGVIIANKKYAFYFKKDFINEINKLKK